MDKWDGYKVSGVKVLDIIEESADAIEKMVNKAILDVHANNIKILDVLISGDNLILVLGEKDSPKR